MLSVLFGGVGHAGAASPGKSAHLPPFDVTVSLSPDAAKTITQSKETVVVAAYFLGDPIPEAESMADNMGIQLGPKRIELHGAGVARFPKMEIDPANLKLIQSQNLTVLINVFSGRRSSTRNLLNCGIFQDRISRAASEGVNINCTLLFIPPPRDLNKIIREEAES